ncbi:DnaJ domain-containing protein [Microcystis aeruginosa]|jgi:Flp pilus assembly protein TadD|nr:DnaJ domain-containing protein [Microcystis aeruginosa]MDB9396151.1 DnaJ domain-containing protein [Microcystis aeruginosa CS-573]
MIEEFVNYYEILEISPTAGQDEIEQQYKAITRRLRNLQNNPDLNIQQEATRKSEELPKAKKVLLDPVERQKYNQQLEEYQRRQKQAPSQDAQDNDIASSSELIKEGYRLFSIGAINAALAVAKQATARYGDDPNTWALLAEARFRTNDIEWAIFEYKRAIDLRPNEAKFHHSLGQVFKKAKRNDDAIIAYSKAIELAPNQIYYALTLGRFLGELERWDGSVNILEDCYKRQSNSPEVAEALMIAYDGWIKANSSSKSLEDIKTTLKLIDKALAIGTDSEMIEIKQSLQQLRKTYFSYLGRKFNGNYFLGLYASFWWAGFLSHVGSDVIVSWFWILFIFIGILYYLSSLAPYYICNNQKNSLENWFSNQTKDIKGWLFIIFFGLTIYTFCFPGFIIINFFNNYKKHNPSQDEYLREVIESMKSK